MPRGKERAEFGVSWQPATVVLNFIKAVVFQDIRERNLLIEE